MMELIRNCSHGSEIATYFVLNKGSKGDIIKAAATPSGISNLLREAAGLGWYQKIRSPQDSKNGCEIILRKCNYIKIKIPFVKGNKANYNSGLEVNADLVRRVIRHYCDIWPFTPQKYSPLHGDFSIDNVIFNPEGIHIIDWEHFSDEGAPWGYDALYFLFETLWFGMKKRSKPTRREIDIITGNIKILNAKNYLLAEMAGQPLKYVRDFIRANNILWGHQMVNFPDKLPVVMFSDEQITRIDESILNGMRL